MSATKAVISSRSRGAVVSRTHSLESSSNSGIYNPIPLLNSEATLLAARRKESFNSSESDLASESCSEFDPPSPDSIFDESNIFGLPEKSHLDNLRHSTSRNHTTKFMQVPIRKLFRVKRGVNWELTLGDIVQEIFLQLQPGLASTVKEVLMENTSSPCVCMPSINVNGSRATVSSTASDSFVSDDPHASSFVQLNYGVDEEMKEMKKILDNPWNPDEIFDLSRLQIETMDCWKKDFGRLTKVLEDEKEIQSVEDAWDTTTVDAVSKQNSGVIVSSIISTSNSNQASQVQHKSPVHAQRKAFSSQKKCRVTIKSRKPFRVCIFSTLLIMVLVIAAMMTFVVLELEFYRSATSVREDASIWFRLRQQPGNQFFLSSNFV